MEEHIAFLLRGLGSGGVFAALAMALVVTFRSSGVINFATGAVALYTAETYAYLRAGELFVPFPGLPPLVDLGTELGLLPAVVISLAIAAVLGVLLHFVVFRPLLHSPEVAKAVASIGVLIALQALIALRLGTNPITTPAILPTDNVEVFGEAVRGDRLWFAAVIVVLALALAGVMRFTKFGLATRAVAETEKGAFVTGLAPQRIAVANWALSSVVAGIAGILISPIVPVTPISYTLFIVPALAAALVGGFTALAPAVAAGLVIGMVQSELVFLQLRFDWLPQSGTPELVPLVLIMIVLVVRGRPLPGRGAVVVRTLGRAPRPERVTLRATLGAMAGLGLLLFTSGGYRSGVILSFILGVIALSWVVVSGYAGQISLAQLSIAGVGAFSLHRLAEDLGIPFPFAPLLAALCAGVVGVLFGLSALRIRGLPVAVVTLALAAGLEAFWFRNPDLNGGIKGASISSPSFLGIDLDVAISSSRVPFGVLCLAVFVAVGVAVALLRRSRLGSAMLAVKANERSAAAAGVDVSRTKLIAFGIGAFIAGLGGSLLAYQQTAAIPQTYGAIFGLGLFTVVYLSGITSVGGGVHAGFIASGGVLFVILDRNFELAGWYVVITGVFLVVTVIFNPEGVVGMMGHVLTRRGHSDDALADPAPHLDRVDVPTGSAAAGSGRTVLRIDGISVRYGGITAVDDVSLDVEEGTIVGLIGPNGAGKTTLVDAVSGFTPCEGTVELGDEPIHHVGPHRRARAGLTRTFQNVELYDDLTVLENVRVGQEAARHRLDGAEADEQRLDQILEMLDLGTVRDQTVKELSAGYRQLVSIGRALASRPIVLLLDEPAAGLDTSESRWLGARLRSVRDAGVSILMIDHDMSLVLTVCDRVHVLDVGELIASGRPDEIRENEAVMRAYLGGAFGDLEAV